ncbi:MAG: hypothetical protein KIT84_05470 [Labilithrix sp.]|nr:hypothetical protein [Labilithrix sp.]MCW5810437.1 hypothetical protein [Labilithrix sp.]
MRRAVSAATQRATLLAALALIAGCSTTSAPPPPSPLPTPPPIATTAEPAAPKSESALASKESKQVARALARVSALRGVNAQRPVPGVKLERSELVGRIKEKALREYPPEALKREGELLQLLGFAPASFVYLDELLKLLDAQLEGFYEPKNGTMYLANDLKGKEAQATLAHELVHALQDQSWDLKSRSTYKPGEGDKTLALACLAEGDATSLMIDYAMADEGGVSMTALDPPESSLREMMAAGMKGESIKNVPHILKASLMAPYVDGLFFVNAARRKGGWAAVNRVWENPPTTTEQVLHFDKWEKHEPPLTVSPPTANALGSGWKKDDEDSFGELEFALMYEEWTESHLARLAASGWGGDRSAIYVKGDEMAFAVHERYDADRPRPDGFSERAFTKVTPGMKKTLGKPALETPTAICFERSDLGPLLLARRDRELVIAAGPAKRGAGGWTSTATCAQTKKWADEVLANP